MADGLTPTLEDLRDVPEAAWLWDSARARIVWANPAGVDYFGGDTLFDLIGRPFDFGEAGITRIASLSRQLVHGQVREALLHFPSSGHAAPVPCRVMLHALPDGRPGMLTVATVTAAQQAGASQAEIASAFDLLPDAALIVSKDGKILHLNAAALVMLGAGQRIDLAGLLDNSGVSDELLTRVLAAGTVSVIRTVALRLGERQVRLTLRRMGQGPGAAILILLDDVTERRRLEQGLPPVHLPPVTASAQEHRASAKPDDADTFERIGRTLRRDTAEPPGTPQAEAPPVSAVQPVEPATPLARPSVPLRKPDHVPAVLRSPLDKRPEPLLIVRNGHVVHANPAACSFFGFDSLDDLVNDGQLAGRFGALGQSLPATEIALDGGRTVTAAVQMTVVPWHGGPARQFILRPAEMKASAPFDTQLTSVTPLPRTADAQPLAPSRKDEPQAAAPPSNVIALPQRSQQAETDDELRAILDTAADGIITLDGEAAIHTFSAAAESIFGYRLAEVAGKPLGDLLDASSRKVLRDYLAALQGPGLASVFNDGREVSAVVKQGGTVPLFLTIGKLQSPRSNAAFCAVVRDITQWKKTEAELREAKERAEATSRQKSEFLARISHELRTPLNAIMGFSDVMRLGRFGDIENEKYRGYVNDIHASGGHLLSLINDLLDLSKVESGRLELNFTSVNLGEVIDHAMQMLQDRATAARVVLRRAWPAPLPNVVADLRSMRQVAINLLGNAIKFTDPGGEVIVSGQLTAAGALTLRVRDTGIGMNAEQLRDALEPFRRVTTDGREVEGTGLGLPLTKALAEANRAAFAISSEPRKGTLVEITFPTTRVLAE